jgi:hypothetical protein
MRMRFAAYLTDDEPPELALYWSECAEPSFGTNPAGARRPRLVSGQLRRPAVPPEAARPLISNGAALDQNLQPGHWARSSTTSTGGWSASSSRTSSTCSVLRPSGIVSPGLQFGTVLLISAGSAGVPCGVSSLNRNPPFGSPFHVGWDRTAGRAYRGRQSTRGSAPDRLNAIFNTP